MQQIPTYAAFRRQQKEIPSNKPLTTELLVVVMTLNSLSEEEPDEVYLMPLLPLPEQRTEQTEPRKEMVLLNGASGK